MTLWGRSLVVESEPIKIQYIRINNDIINQDMPWHTNRFMSDDDDHYRGLYVEYKCEFICYNSDYYRYLCYYDEFNNIITYDLVIGSICNYNTWTCKITMLPLNMQNYHFFPRDDILDLISKNYYEFVFTWISWLRNLFQNLMIIYT